jgi:hypothetical protein
MSKYIGPPVVSLVTDTVDVTGDITTTDATPEVIIVNDTHEDTDGGREGKVTFKGQQSGGEETTLAQIQASHDGTSDDEKGDLIFKTNDGSDGASPTTAMVIDSGQNILIGKTDAETTISGGTPAFQITGAGFDSISSHTRREASASGAALILAKSRNTTPNNYTIVQDGDTLGSIIFIGDDGTNLDTYGASIAATVEATPGANDMPTRLTFSTTADGAASPTERMRIANHGNIGLGYNSDPQSLVHILSGNTGFVASNGAGVNGIQLSRSTGNSENLYIYTSSGAGFNAGGTGFVGRIETYGNNALEIGSQQTVAIVFGTGNTERARFNASDGKLKLGDANDAAHTFTSSNILQTEFGCAFGHNHVVWATGAHTSAYNVQVFRNGNGIVGHIQTSGSATSYQTSSDYRLKENVVDITDGITRVKQLSPRRFNFIADPDTTVDGFIAHEAQTVVPEAVSGTKDGMMDEEYEVTPIEFDDDGRIINDAVMGTRSVPDIQGIDQAKLVPLLTAALQEAIAKIETLETKVAALEGE